MKTTLKLFAIFFALFLTVACNKEKYNYNEPPASPFNGKITAVVENGKVYDSIVSKVIVGYFNYISNGIIYGMDTIAISDYSNGGFTMTLLVVLDDEWLVSIGNWIGYDLKISDKNAKIGDLGFFISVDSNDRFVDWIDYGKFDENSFTEVLFIYTDRDVIVTGSFKEHGYSESIGISLKRGWNKVYYSEIDTEYEIEVKISTKAIDGMKWYFWNDFDSSKNTKNVLRRIAR
jgi:hypothetical protein